MISRSMVKRLAIQNAPRPVQCTEALKIAPRGNTKVHCPIVNLGSGTSCPSAARCPFSLHNYKATGYPLCYAVKGERRFKAVLAAREHNAMLIIKWIEQGPETVRSAAQATAAALAKACNGMHVPYVRINESGDFSYENFDFALELIRALVGRGRRPFAYSKAHPTIIKILRGAGCVILQSETDFVCVKDKSRAKAIGLKLCPGVGCGKTCLRCPKGLRSAVIAH